LHVIFNNVPYKAGLETGWGFSCLIIVITGCAHPNVADMAEQAQAYLAKNIYLLMGGFHLGGKSDAEIRAIIDRLKALGVN
jgi:7,8-dihydropterin-6-yl-methyl-4-(beta-D-ribofuranosyl)aminobenzene 5'-phosphate synthase